MFKQNKLQIFSFRKVKGYGLASAVIASMFLMQGVVSADVVTTPDGTKTTLSNDKASITVDANHFKDSNDKTAKELYDAKEYEADKVTTGKDTIINESKTVVSFETEDGTKLKEDVKKTTTEEKELNYKVEGPSGKEYTGTSTTTSTVNADLEKQDTIEKDGEKYKYVRTETTQGSETVLTNTQFNDVETKASVEGMYNEDGSIKYNKIKDGSRVWVLEEKEDGTYGNYALIENAQGLSDEKIREAAKTATTKFSKAEVEKLGGIKSTDSIVVYETNTYAARKQTSEQFGKDFHYEHTANSSNFYKSYIDDIYKVGLDGLEKQGDKYVYKGQEVPTIEDFKTNYVARTDGSEGLGEYPTDESNKYYSKSSGMYAVPTTYYDVLSDFLIAHPDSPIFAGKAKEVFWGDGEEEYYFNVAFVARLLNNSFKSKYNLNIDTQNFSNKPLDSKAEDSRPTEKKTYSFVRTDLKGDADTFMTSHYGTDDDIWKHEIGLSYSPENVEKVRRWVKGYKSMNGESASDVFNNKPTSEITQQEYIEAVFNNVFNFYLSTFKDQLEPEQIKELRAKFGDSVFNIIGNSVGADIENPETYVVNGNGSHLFRNSLGVVTENTETFTYHNVITPLRAYRLTADNNLIRHIYKQAERGSVERGSVIVTHKDTKGNELAPAEKIVTDGPDGEPYTTNEKSFPNKSVIERQPDGSVRIRITGYRLTKTPENKNGRVTGGSVTTVPYVYEEIVITNIENKPVVKKGSVIATYKDTDGNELSPQETIKSNTPNGEDYTTAAKSFDPIVTTDTVDGLTRTTTTTYELVETPANANGKVKGGETITVPYVYRKVVKQEINGSVVVTHYDENGVQLAPDEKIKDNVKSGEHYTSSPKQFDSTNITANANGLTQRISSRYELVRTPANNSGKVEGGKTIIVPYVYRKVSSIILNGSVIATYKDTEGNELAPAEQIKTNVPGGEAYTTSSKEIPNKVVTDKTPEGFTRTTTTTYQLVENPTNKDGRVKDGSVITVPYVYKKVVKQEINGSVIVTHYDENGVQLAPDEKIKDNVKSGEHYTSSPKQFDSTNITANANGLTQRIYSGYELVRTPANNSGEVEGGKTIIVPYVYRKVSSIIFHGSVIATHKDTEGNELAPAEQIKTNVPGGESYSTNEKSFPNKSVVEKRPDGSIRIQVIGYKLVKTPENKDGRVKGGSVITVPYVYEKVVIANIENKPVEKPKSEIPKDAPKVDIKAVKATRFMLENRKTEIKDMVDGFVKPIQTIDNYVYTGVTDSDEGGAVITHIYKSVKPDVPTTSTTSESEIPTTSELPKDSPDHNKPEYKGGVVPNDAPIHDKPEYKGGVIPNDSPVHDKPEYNGGAVPNDSPIHDKPEYNGGAVPNDSPVHDKPEYKGGVVPNDAPVHDKPEFNGGVVPNDSPVHNKPKLDIPTPEIPTPTPELPKPETPSVETPKPKPQEKYVTKELPNTGSESSALGLLGFAGVIGSLLLLKKQKED